MKQFITFEGVDGGGKSSHVEWFSEQLRARGHRVVNTREPGGTVLGEKIRDLLLYDEMSAQTELMLMFASRRELLTTLIEPELASGAIVISDRFADSSYAFQGGGRGIPYEQIEALDAWCGGTRPDLTVIFDLPVEVALARVHKRGLLDRFEREALDYHQRVRAAYRRRADEDPERIRVVDANRSIEEIRFELESLLDQIGPRKAGSFAQLINCSR